MMVVTSHARAEVRNSPKAARNHAKRRSYVALLSIGPRGSISRRFVEKHREGNRITFSVAHQPGDIYEVRRWLWDGVREAFIGGTEWIGFDENNRPFMLTREEAERSLRHRDVGAGPLGLEVNGEVVEGAPRTADILTPAGLRLPRMLPADIRFSVYP